MKSPVRIVPGLLPPLVLVSTLAAGQPERLTHDRLRRPAGATLFRTPIGLCEDYPWESTTPEKIRSDLMVLRRTGVNLLRFAFGWDSIEPRRAQFTWLSRVEVVKTAACEFGVILISPSQPAGRARQATSHARSKISAQAMR